MDENTWQALGVVSVIAFFICACMAALTIRLATREYKRECAQKSLEEAIDTGNLEKMGVLAATTDPWWLCRAIVHAVKNGKTEAALRLIKMYVPQASPSEAEDYLSIVTKTKKHANGCTVKDPPFTITSYALHNGHEAMLRDFCTIDGYTIVMREVLACEPKFETVKMAVELGAQVNWMDIAYAEEHGLCKKIVSYLKTTYEAHAHNECGCEACVHKD